MNTLNAEQVARLRCAIETRDANAVIGVASMVMEERMLYGSRDALTTPNAVRDYLRMRLSTLEREVFLCIWLDSQHRVIECEEAFRGTLGHTAVHVREVVKTALRLNAAAVIFAHNHPSGVPTPSRADELLTRNLKEALALVDVRTLDHMIVAPGAEVLSMAERGLV